LLWRRCPPTLPSTATEAPRVKAVITVSARPVVVAAAGATTAICSTASTSFARLAVAVALEVPAATGLEADFLTVMAVVAEMAATVAGEGLA
jgi:hypothetical protein